MRFILMAIALMGVGLYLANPQAFGAKGKFNTSNAGHVVVNQRGAARVDLGKIEASGAALFGKIASSLSDSPAPESPQSQPAAATTDVASAVPSTPETPASSKILSAIEAPDLSTYNGRLAAIYTALNQNPEQTSAAMHDATKACLSPGASDILVNYFVQMVQLTAKTAHHPLVEQAAYFKTNSAPLTNLVKVWLGSLPEAESTIATQELQSWAARPVQLVACHFNWLNSRQ